ncbi:NAD(P)H-dependent oxidoreductase [Pseudonocardia sp. NPDC049635]|uniref:NAD(P)H-dependent oxidoreductase n=1 Tax=Pseudonocardia sp. NPDC049635 TaxID=3155506 RepID=UPI0033CD068E
MPTSMIVLAHPRPGSFSHALAATAAHALRECGHRVCWHDLHDEGFDPVNGPEGLDTTRPQGASAFSAGADPLTARHRRELAAAHTLVVVHPNWWGKPPAIMAGWMDRVLVPGVVYRLDEAAGEPTPLLALRRLVVLNTGDTAPARETEVFGDPLDAIWRRCVGEYLHHAEVRRLLAGPLANSTAEQRRAWLDDAYRLTTR